MAPARKIAKRKRRGPKRVVLPPKQRKAASNAESSSETPRPTRYTEDIGERICERMANGETATEVCRDPTMPVWSTLKRWERDNADFAKRYDIARRQCCEYQTDEIISIADDATNDYVTRADGRRMFDRESFERSRLRMQARQWTASKILRHVYGDKSEVDLRTPDGVNVKVEERNTLIDAICKLVHPKADGRTKPESRKDEPRER